MKHSFFFVAFLFATNLLSAQADIIIQQSPTGGYSVQIQDTGGKDPLWKALVIATKEIKAKRNTILSLMGEVYTVAYTKDTKTYTVFSLGEMRLAPTTTIAAVRAAIAADSYRSITGYNAPTSTN